MDFIATSRKGTVFFNDFLDAYYNSDELNDFRSFAPSLESVPDIIKSRSDFPSSRRATLVDCLKAQYLTAGIELDRDLRASIDSISKETTFTVTTGQQIHVGLGPLYVLYKAYDTIALVAELKTQHPEYNFVPVFWMASEDHDLEEISEVNIFGNKHKWETPQVGPVGRMNTEGLPELFSEILKEYRFAPEQEEFLKICSEIYSISDSLSIAFRKIMHHYMGHLGLVILDADDAALKLSFTEVLSDELQHKNYASLVSQTKKLAKAGINAQLHIRECGLFDMRGGGRERVTQKYSEEEADKLAVNNAYDLSPNAAFRPLYQEWILPNLIYVGGPSEIKYWMQLKSLFHTYEMEMPLLHLRTSQIHIPAKLFSKYTQEEWLSLLSSRESIIEKNNVALKILTIKLENEYSKIQEAITSYQETVESNFTGFSLKGKLAKVAPKLSEIEKLVGEQVIKKGEQNPILNKVLKTKDKFFSETAVQERSEHVLAHAELLELSLEMVNSSFGSKKSQKITLLFV